MPDYSRPDSTSCRVWFRIFIIYAPPPPRVSRRVEWGSGEGDKRDVRGKTGRGSFASLGWRRV